jgi:Ca2+-binding EF-hand superfamily protein
MRIASVGSSSFDPSQFINRLAAGASQKGQSQSNTATTSISDMATTIARSVIETADTDGDGALTVEESGQSEQVFNRFDTDDDGLLSEDELIIGMTDDITALQSMFETGTTPSGSTVDMSSLFDLGAAGLQIQPPPPPPPGEDMGGITQMATDLATSFLEAADSDGDGALTLEESGQSEDVFNRFDADSDGLLSEDELAEGLQEDMETLQSMMASGSMETSSLFDLQAAGVEPPGSAQSASGASGSGSSGSSSGTTETSTTTSVTETANAIVTTTTTTTTTTASDGTVTTETTSSSSSKPKAADKTSLLYKALEGTMANTFPTLDVQA